MDTLSRAFLDGWEGGSFDFESAPEWQLLGTDDSENLCAPFTSIFAGDSTAKNVAARRCVNTRPEVSVELSGLELDLECLDTLCFVNC